MLHRVINLQFRIGLNKCFVVDGQGKGGDLALYWDDSIKINILSYGMHHMDTLIWDGREPLYMESHAHKLGIRCGSC
jgi:hypothetical protein